MLPKPCLPATNCCTEHLTPGTDLGVRGIRGFVFQIMPIAPFCGTQGLKWLPTVPLTPPPPHPSCWFSASFTASFPLSFSQSQTDENGHLKIQASLSEGPWLEKKMPLNDPGVSWMELLKKIPGTKFFLGKLFRHLKFELGPIFNFSPESNPI